MNGKVAVTLSRAEAYEALVLVRAALTYRADRGKGYGRERECLAAIGSGQA